MDLSLAKLPWYAQLGAFLILACAGVGAFYWYYEKDARAEMRREAHLQPERQILDTIAPAAFIGE